MKAQKEILDPRTVLAEAGTDDPLELVQIGIASARAEDYDRASILLTEAYLRLSQAKDVKMPPALLSFYGLCMGISKGRIKEGAEYCQLAIDKEFYNGEHYANLARVWLAGKSRKKAVETLERGLQNAKGSKELLRLRKQMGFRQRPAVPFLKRGHPINVKIGQIRSGKKSD